MFDSVETKCAMYKATDAPGNGTARALIDRETALLLNDKRGANEIGAALDAVEEFFNEVKGKKNG